VGWFWNIDPKPFRAMVNAGEIIEDIEDIEDVGPLASETRAGVVLMPGLERPRLVAVITVHRHVSDCVRWYETCCN
jgi:hypothetical protein